MSRPMSNHLPAMAVVWARLTVFAANSAVWIYNAYTILAYSTGR